MKDTVHSSSVLVSVNNCILCTNIIGRSKFFRSAYCKVLEIFVVSDKLGILYSYRYKVSNLLLNENLTQKIKGD